MRVLVTGGAGFIGSHIVDALVKDGYEVRILDNLDPQVHASPPGYLNSQVEMIDGDIRNEDDIRKSLKNVEIVIHHAAAVGVGQSMYQIKKYVDVNSNSTAKMLDIIVNDKYPIRKLIVASSMSIYGEGAYTCPNCGIVYPKLRSEAQLEAEDWDHICAKCGSKLSPIPTDEDKPQFPTSVYAISKRDQEELCLSVGRAYKIPTVALRYFNAYGPRQSLSNPYTGVCAIFLSQIKNSQRPRVLEDGQQSRDFVSVHDIVQANLLAIHKDEADYESFNVASGRVVTIREIALILTRLLGKNVEPEVTNKFRTGDIRHCYADITKIKTRLGYSPKIALEEGMQELIQWSEKEQFDDKTAGAQAELSYRHLIK